MADTLRSADADDTRNVSAARKQAKTSGTRTSADADKPARRI